MTEDATPGQKYNVTHSAPFEDSGVQAGVVSIDATQHLQVVSAEADFAAKLDLAATMLNSADALVVNEPPPPEEQTRHQYRRMVERDEPTARDALLEILQDRYGFALTLLD